MTITIYFLLNSSITVDVYDGRIRYLLIIITYFLRIYGCKVVETDFLKIGNFTQSTDRYLLLNCVTEEMIRCTFNAVFKPQRSILNLVVDFYY